MKGADLLHVQTLSHLPWARGPLLEILYQPRIPLWQGLTPDAFSQTFQEIQTHLQEEPDLLQFIVIQMITQFLLEPERPPPWLPPLLKALPCSAPVLAPLAWEACSQGRWTTMPVLLTRDRPFLRHIVVGCTKGPSPGPLYPSWAQDLLDPEARKAIQYAAHAALALCPAPSDACLFCFPLALPNGCVQFAGGSLGLPVALGFLEVLRQEKGTPGIAATGVIQSDGAVGSAGQMAQKLGLAKDKGFRLFLYPAQNPSPVVTEGLEILPVSHLEEAWMASCLYQPGRISQFHLLKGMLQDPHTFVHNLENVSCRCLDWAWRQGRTALVVQKVLSSPVFFEGLVQALKSCLDGWDLERAEFLGRLLEGMDLSSVAGRSPLALFRWHTHNLALANHRGRVAEAREQARLAEPLLETARKSDLDACAEYHNHCFIHLHNRYSFVPRLTPPLQQTLAQLQARFSLQRQHGCLVDPALGALYGSLAQNYAFSGPEFLDKTRENVHKAREAFGNGEVVEQHPNVQRPLFYWTYACLDAGRFEEAETTLLQILDLDSRVYIKECTDTLSPWTHALLARFLADAWPVARASGYTDQAQSNRTRWVQGKHPWQLWLYNVGRLLVLEGNPTEAVLFFRQSLEQCLAAFNGPTIRVMALLPLSRLLSLGESGETLALDAKKAMHAARELHPAFFAPVLAQEPLQALEEVARRPERFFPFAYR